MRDERRYEELGRLIRESEAKKVKAEESTQGPFSEKALYNMSRPSLEPAALHGLPGDIVSTIGPHTEADEAALLIQLLAGFGNAIGRSAFFSVGSTRHYTKLFAVLVGDTSQGRKGTSWGEISNLLLRADKSFGACVINGLSTGEGLIYRVRDPQTKPSPIRKNGKIVGYEDEVVDGGTKEKRAFVIEPEFGRSLKVMARDGNTLSAIIRESWDSDKLNVLTKNPLKATGTHISLVGHVNGYELRKYLTEAEQASGFANRILWVCVKRSKSLPFGGDLQKSDVNRLGSQLQDTINFGRSVREVKLSDKAKRLWANEYDRLSKGHPGMLGAVTSRAAPQVLRIACVYALMDLSKVIRTQHLGAALAVWKYCEDSAKYIFGLTLGNRIAERIFEFLSEHRKLSRTEINNLLGRNCSARQLDEALDLLIELEKIEKKVLNDGPGRPKALYRVKKVRSKVPD